MVLNRQRRVPVAVGALAAFVERVRQELRFPERSVTVQLVSNSAMARLNRTFRGRRGPTDVLSFPARAQRIRGRRPARTPGSFRADGAPYVGDIAIAPETARRNAQRFSRTLPTELRILVLHGMIHLAGYDHETDRGQMRRFEQALRDQFGLLPRR
jgi:probable rRNA maturation factor